MVKVNIKTTKKDNKDKTKALKREVSKKASMANKRLKRLEKNNLQDTPAYSNWVEYGNGAKFSVKGKDYNELQAELARVNNFIDSATSTVRGTTKVLRSMASTIGLNTKNVKIDELYAMTSTFFNLASKVEQYLSNATGSASAIGYQKIWKVINEYVEKEQLSLDMSVEEMNGMLDDLLNLALEEYKGQAMDSLFDSVDILEF